MVVLAHYFGGHVPRSTASFVTIVYVRDPLSSDTKVSQLEVAPRVEDQVLRLDVPMDNLVAVNRFQRMQQAGAEKTGLFLGKLPLASQVEAQVASKE